jgi:transcriptional regulator with GAF, ATPase, and Fis domain
MVGHLVERLAARHAKPPLHVPVDVMRALQRHEWPGNVRELENVLERAVILSRGGALRLDGRELSTGPDQASDALVDVERSHILRVLARVGWRIEGEGGAARILGLKASTLRSRMSRLGIQRPVHEFPRPAHWPARLPTATAAD